MAVAFAHSPSPNFSKLSPNASIESLHPSPLPDAAAVAVARAGGAGVVAAAAVLGADLACGWGGLLAVGGAGAATAPDPVAVGLDIAFTLSTNSRFSETSELPNSLNSVTSEPPFRDAAQHKQQRISHGRRQMRTAANSAQHIPWISEIPTTHHHRHYYHLFWYSLQAVVSALLCFSYTQVQGSGCESLSEQTTHGAAAANLRRRRRSRRWIHRCRVRPKEIHRTNNKSR